LVTIPAIFESQRLQLIRLLTNRLLQHLAGQQPKRLFLNIAAKSVKDKGNLTPRAPPQDT